MSKVGQHWYVPTTGCLNLSAICKLDTRIKKPMILDFSTLRQNIKENHTIPAQNEEIVKAIPIFRKACPTSS